MSVITNTYKNIKNIMRSKVITDPDDPNVKDFYNELINYNIVVSHENLNRGLIKHDIVYDLNDPNSKKIHDLIKKINYDPITVSIELSSDELQNIKYIIDVIKALSNKILKEQVINVEYVKYIKNNIVKKQNQNQHQNQNNNQNQNQNQNNVQTYIVVFTPICKNNETLLPIYENHLYLDEYYKILNIDLLKKYKLLSEDSLANYVLNELYKNNEYVYLDVEPISIKDVMLYPNNKSDKISNDVEFLTESKRSKGYFTYKIGVHNRDDVEFIKELAIMWDTKIPAIYKSHVVLKPNPSIDFGLNSLIWFKKNINLIKYGLIPKITLFGSWQYHNDSYSQIHDKVWYKSILYYAAMLAYKKLSDSVFGDNLNPDEFIKPFVFNVIVNNDYSVSISVPTYNHSILFKKYMEEIVNTYKNSTLVWNIEPCKNLLDAIIKRYHVQNTDNKTVPIIVSHDNEETKHNTNLLIYRSPVYKYGDSKEIDFTKINIKTIKSSMISDFEKYYNFDCNDNKYNCEEILNIIEINKDGNKYLHSREDVLSTNLIDENTLLKAKYLDWGLRGLFNVGPLKGLYNDVPSKILIKPLVGKPIYNVFDDIVSISIYFENNNKKIIKNKKSDKDGKIIKSNKDGKISKSSNIIISSLFDIKVDKNLMSNKKQMQDQIKDLTKNINNLWYQGYFLNYWTSAVQKYQVDVESFNVVVNNKILLDASNSNKDGKIAINFLQRMNPGKK